MPGSPAFQFYAADYLADENVSVMTLEEEGAYWRAIAYCWREGSIPADDGRLSRLLKGATNQTLTVVRNCFNQMATDPTRLIHPRLEIERKKQAEWRSKSSEAGKKSGKSRRDKKFSTEPTFNSGSTKPEPNANQTGTLLLQSSSSSSLNTKTKTRPQKVLVAECPLEWIDHQAWMEFWAMRESNRWKTTDGSVKRILTKLQAFHDKGLDCNEILGEAIIRNWRGLFEIKENGGNNGQGNHTKTGGNLSALEEVIRRNQSRGIADGVELCEDGDDRREHLGLPQPAIIDLSLPRRAGGDQGTLPYQAQKRGNGLS